MRHIVALSLVSLTVLLTAPASAQVCPPKVYFCWQVRSLAELYGVAALESHVRACGWTEIEIARAKRCLK